jgi:hypothetical protein
MIGFDSSYLSVPNYYPYCKPISSMEKINFLCENVVMVSDLNCNKCGFLPDAKLWFLHHGTQIDQITTVRIVSL